MSKVIRAKGIIEGVPLYHSSKCPRETWRSAFKLFERSRVCAGPPDGNMERSVTSILGMAYNFRFSRNHKEGVIADVEIIKHMIDQICDHFEQCPTPTYLGWSASGRFDDDRVEIVLVRYLWFMHDPIDKALLQ